MDKSTRILHWIKLCILTICTIWPGFLMAQETQIEKIAGRVVQMVYGFETHAPLSPAAERQVRDIAHKVSVEMPVTDEAFQRVYNEADGPEGSDNSILGKITRIVAIGIIIFLLLLIVYTVVHKLEEKKKDNKDRLRVTVNDRLRTAPFVLIIPAQSEAEADHIGRTLVQERLAARADIYAHHHVAPDMQAGTVLVVNTVKGRLKAIQKRLRALSMSGSYLSIPVLHGYGPYMNQIANAADGRG